MQHTLSFILLQGHKERVRYAAVRCSPEFTYAAGNPTLYTVLYRNSYCQTVSVIHTYVTYITYGDMQASTVSQCAALHQSAVCL